VSNAFPASTPAWLKMSFNFVTAAPSAHLKIRHDVNEYANQDNGCAHSAKISRVRAPDAVEAIAVEIFRQCECSGQVVSMAVIDRGPRLTECGSRSFI
jgi:hypothetical protein